MRKLISFLILFTCSATLMAQGTRITREEYINTYKDIAISEMNRTGVPASIKLAQGILETGNGNSRLAIKGNNHFGIKCHNSWKGKKIHHDDDERGECFRKYKSPEESFLDHSDFLRGSVRYSFLFNLEITDYKGWAWGLQKAGYATSPTYATSLIRIIEENKLDRFDRLLPALQPYDPSYTDGSAGRQIFRRNRIKYIVFQEGDNLEDLRKELKLMPNQLRNYNEISSDVSVNPGQILYIQPKRNSAEAGTKYHIVQQGETMHDISQLYGIKLTKLYEKNHIKYGTEPEAGQELSLRKKVKGDKPFMERNEKNARKKRVRENLEESDKIEFEFFEN